LSDNYVETGEEDNNTGGRDRGAKMEPAQCRIAVRIELKWSATVEISDHVKLCRTTTI
jgi:hypothetical protein